MHARFTAGFTLLAMLLPAAGFASVLEEVVVTANRVPVSVAEVGGQVSRITEADLEIVSAVHINELFHRVPGAWISRGNGQEHLTALRSPVLTGAGACGAFLMMQDGIPLRARGFCNVNELFDANHEQARRIEVIKGPSGVTYGSNALHGLINILSGNLGNARSLGIETGPHGYYRLKGTFATERFRVDANGAHDGGYKDDSGFDQQKLSLQAAFGLGDWDATGALHATNLNQETAGFIVGSDAYKDDALVRTNPNPEAYRDTENWRGHLRFERSLSATRGITVTPFARSTEMTFIQHFLPGQAVEQNGHDSIGVQALLYDTRFQTGIDVELTSGMLREFQPGPTPGSAFLVATIPQGLHYDYEVDAAVIAAFGQFDLVNTASFTATIGARLEQVRYDYDNLMLDGRTKDDGTECGFGGCRFNRPADRSDRFTDFSPQLSLTWSLSDAAQAYGRVTRGFRAPQATELYRLQANQTVSAIDSEQLDAIELGLRGTRGAVNYDLLAFFMEKDNFIFRDTNRTNVDNGETSHRGIEVTIAAEITETVSAHLDATWAVHRYENNPALVSTPIAGNDIDTAPRHFGSFRVQWTPGPRLTTELEWSHLGAYYQDPENQQQYEGHDLLHWRARFRLNDQVQFALRVTNLTDRKYAERADFAFGSDRYFVGESRGVYASVEIAM